MSRMLRSIAAVGTFDRTESAVTSSSKRPGAGKFLEFCRGEQAGLVHRLNKHLRGCVAQRLVG